MPNEAQTCKQCLLRMIRQEADKRQPGSGGELRVHCFLSSTELRRCLKAVTGEQKPDIQYHSQNPRTVPQLPLETQEIKTAIGNIAQGPHHESLLLQLLRQQEERHSFLAWLYRTLCKKDVNKSKREINIRYQQFGWENLSDIKNVFNDWKKKRQKIGKQLPESFQHEVVFRECQKIGKMLPASFEHRNSVGTKRQREPSPDCDDLDLNKVFDINSTVEMDAMLERETGEEGCDLAFLLMG